MNILDIKSPADIKKLNIDQLNDLCKDIRTFLINSVSKTGGHLASNLGVVELTVALHYCFNAPEDKILFDVGHQSYIHKILTGRADQMSTLRQFDGMAGFQKRNESEYDCFEAGHSSTSLSTALGMAIARDLNNEHYEVIPVVGDASIMSGLSLEALNNIGYKRRKMIIVFNDNNISINKSVGALKLSFAKLRTNRAYTSFRENVKDFIINKRLDSLRKAMSKVKHDFKDAVVDSGIFKEFEIEYIGPVDGHNMEELLNAFEAAKLKDGPVAVHVITTKGKGYKYAEGDRSGAWHGVSKFDIETGKSLAVKKEGYMDYSQIIADEVEKIMDEDKDVVCITPAMISGSKLNHINEKYPDRFFDVGIAEDHALCFASGLSLEGKKPFVAIYSSFLQRAYDQLNHDIARMNLPVLIGIDRAGLVGEDGETHHGVFDISFLRPLPNVVIAQGKDAKEAQSLVYTGYKYNGPFCIRYPRGTVKYEKNAQISEIKVGIWEKTVNNIYSEATIVTYGDDVVKVTERVLSDKLPYEVINARFIKPIDSDMLIETAANGKPLIIYTTDMLKGGLGDEILECLSLNGLKNDCYIIGIDDIFVKHGNIDKLKKYLKIDIDSLFEFIESILC